MVSCTNSFDWDVMGIDVALEYDGTSGAGRLH
jgi:hypothetical protein